MNDPEFAERVKRAKSSMIDQIDQYPCLHINAPDWYKRKDFQDYLNIGASLNEGTAVATWHRVGNPPDSSSDIFAVFSGPEDSSEVGLMPDDIHQAIWEIVEEHGYDCAVAWISNVA